MTQLAWFLVMGNNPSKMKSRSDCEDDFAEMDGVTLCQHHPVTSVSWADTQAFIDKLNSADREGYAYRLPTEAEWEYAARAGTQGRFFFPHRGSVSFSSLPSYGWYNRNSDGRTHRVATRKPNPRGLYDMVGNVFQWVQDAYAEFDMSPAVDPVVEKGESAHVASHAARGCGYLSSEEYDCFVYSRIPQYEGSYDLGFRLVRTRK